MGGCGVTSSLLTHNTEKQAAHSDSHSESYLLLLTLYITGFTVYPANLAHWHIIL